MYIIKQGAAADNFVRRGAIFPSAICHSLNSPSNRSLGVMSNKSHKNTIFS